MLWWVFLGALALFSGAGSGGVSRRMANLQYVVWIAAYNSTFLLGYLVLDLAFFPSPLSKSVYSPMSKLKVHPDPDMLKATRHSGGAGKEWDAGGSAPPLLEAVNKNGLVLFLLVRTLTRYSLRGSWFAHPVFTDDAEFGAGKRGDWPD